MPEQCVQRFLPRVASDSPAVVLDLIGQAGRQDLSEPCQKLAFIAPLEIREIAVRPQERLLDDVGGVDLRPQRRPEDHARRQSQTTATPLQHPPEL